MPGKVLGGRYEVQDKIGTGGMATVYRGRDAVLGRTVAIKTMLPQYASDPSFAARFKQEAQAAAALQSPYIVSIFDWGRDADTYYIVMEYLRGTDLKSGIRKHGALDCKKVAQIGSQIAQALSVAHKHDIIHRDIKPQNIMVQPDGNIKVMDFGIARAKNSHLTTDNSVLGTAHYVSPEQTQGRELGPTTDIYSLGIVMYESVTGRVPFEGDDAITVALKQVNEQPMPPSQLNPAVDAALESIILKCMQKNPADRFQTADELHRVLRDYLAGRVAAVSGATATSVMGRTATARLDRETVGSTGATATIPAARASHYSSQYAGSYTGMSATEQAAEEEEERRRKKTRNTIIGVIVGIVVVVCIVLAALSLVGDEETTASVPNLLQYSLEEATEVIEEEGFELGEVTYTYSDTVEAGLVCEQDPEANREAELGSEINLYVSKGSEPEETTTVPDLEGLSASAAEELLESYNLVGAVGSDVESTDIEEGLVASQDIAAGEEVSVGTTITYHLSSGAGEVVVPNVVGDSQSSATERLEASAYGFTVEVEYANSDTVSSGYVISVSPGVGETVEYGATVTITVSEGPASVSVPSVVGLSYAEAKSELEAAGFSVSLTSGSTSGTVLTQSKTGTATKGSTISLTTTEATTSTEDEEEETDTSTDSSTDSSSTDTTDSTDTSTDSSSTDSSSDSSTDSSTDTSTDSTAGTESEETLAEGL